MSDELAGKVAVITGGVNGLGRATVELFLREGAKVVIGDVDPCGEEAARSLGADCRFVRADVADADDVQALVDTAVSEFGGLDIMFNNAGTPSRFVRFLADPLDDFDRNMNVNLLGVMRGTQYAAKHMVRHGGGSIINTSSIAGAAAGVGVTFYRAAKAAVIHFTKTAAIELGEHDIRVNCILPGQIETEMMKDALLATPGMNPEKLDRLLVAMRESTLSTKPLRRRGVPMDIANAALFLASDRSAYITGAILPVDGGTTAGNTNNFIAQFEEVRDRILSEP